MSLNSSVKAMLQFADHTPDVVLGVGPLFDERQVVAQAVLAAVG